MKWSHVIGDLSASLCIQLVHSTTGCSLITCWCLVTHCIVHLVTSLCHAHASSSAAIMGPWEYRIACMPGYFASLCIQLVHSTTGCSLITCWCLVTHCIVHLVTLLCHAHASSSAAIMGPWEYSIACMPGYFADPPQSCHLPLCHSAVPGMTVVMGVFFQGLFTRKICCIVAVLNLGAWHSALVGRP